MASPEAIANDPAGQYKVESKAGGALAKDDNFSEADKKALQAFFLAYGAGSSALNIPGLDFIDSDLQFAPDQAFEINLDEPLQLKAAIEVAEDLRAAKNKNFFDKQIRLSDLAQLVDEHGPWLVGAIASDTVSERFNQIIRNVAKDQISDGNRAQFLEDHLIEDVTNPNQVAQKVAKITLRQRLIELDDAAPGTADAQKKIQNLQNTISKIANYNDNFQADDQPATFNDTTIEVLAVALDRVGYDSGGDLLANIKAQHYNNTALEEGDSSTPTPPVDVEDPNGDANNPQPADTTEAATPDAKTTEEQPTEVAQEDLDRANQGSTPSTQLKKREEIAANEITGNVELRRGSGSQHNTPQDEATIAHVKWVQERLKALGADITTIDGNFGSNTEAAVRQLQAVRKFPQDEIDGVVGAKTIAELKKDSPKIGETPAKSSESSSPTETPTAGPKKREDIAPKEMANTDVLKLRSGYQNSTAQDQEIIAKVKWVQERLKKLGADIDTIDGKYGPKNRSCG